MNRGDLVTVAVRGHYSGNPRPALVMQADVFAGLGSVTICLLSGELIDAPLLRLSVEPTKENGLAGVCQVMIDKIVTVPQGKIRSHIGVLEREVLVRVERSLALFLGVA